MKKLMFYSIALFCCMTAVCCFGNGDGRRRLNPDTLAKIIEKTQYCDSPSYSRYQYFDLFTLSGKDEVLDTPFVLVKKTDSLITVRRSSAVTEPYYIRKIGDFWYNHQEYEMEHADVEGDLCCAGLPQPRIIDLYIKKDTVFESLQQISYVDNSIILITVYTPQECYNIKTDFINKITDSTEVASFIKKSIKSSNFKRGSKKQNIINDWPHFFFTLYEEPDSVILEYDGDSFQKIPKRGLGLFDYRESRWE